MKTRVNGVERELPDGTTVALLLGDLGTERAGIAVAVNERVVGASFHAATELHDGDDVEIVRAVAGGF